MLPRVCVCVCVDFVYVFGSKPEKRDLVRVLYGLSLAGSAGESLRLDKVCIIIHTLMKIALVVCSLVGRCLGPRHLCSP